MQRLLPLAFAALLCAGCATDTATTPGPAASPKLLPGSSVEASGFLGDYSQFRKVPGPFDTWQWVRAGVAWKQYTRLYIEPVEVWINPRSGYQGIEPGLYKRMVDEFRSHVVQEFQAGGYQVVDRPGPGVLKLHFALTGVNPERPGFTPLDVLPIKIAIDAARYATGTDKSVIAITGEAEVLDGVTNERLFAQVTTRKDVHLFIGRQVTWDDVRGGATEWAKQARVLLDKARGVSR
ncbi:MAG: DUF3313 domain-containing protein [Bacteroidota bacterium]